MTGTAHRRHKHHASQRVDRSSLNVPLSKQVGARESNIKKVLPFGSRHVSMHQILVSGVIFISLALAFVVRMAFQWPMPSTISNVVQTKNIMSPFQSHPPNRTDLDIVHNIRHACIHEIRSNRHSFFQPYIDTAQDILLVDPAYHSNVGDHMITVAEFTLLQNRSPESTLSQCSYVQAQQFVLSCDEFFASRLQIRDTTKVALWHGGGNFGNLWPTAQQARIRSLVPLLQSNYTIIGMPNSWYYTNEAIQRKDVQRIRMNILLGLGISTDSAITDHQLADMVKSRIIWTWREHSSYELAIQHLPFCSHQLIPDIAFQLGPYRPIPPSAHASVSKMTDLVLLLRNDHESLYRSIRNRNSIQGILETIPDTAHLSFSIVDWDDRLYRFPSSDPKDIYFTESSIQLLSMGRVVICDRLHAALLAYLSSISFVFLDQVSGKISKTLQVAMESGPSCLSVTSDTTVGMNHKNDPVAWSRAENISDAIRKSSEILQALLKRDDAASTIRQGQKRAREERRNRLRLKAVMRG